MSWNWWDNQLWTMDNQLCTMDNQLWTMDILCTSLRCKAGSHGNSVRILFVASCCLQLENRTKKAANLGLRNILTSKLPDQIPLCLFHWPLVEAQKRKINTKFTIMKPEEMYLEVMCLLYLVKIRMKQGMPTFWVKLWSFIMT